MIDYHYIQRPAKLRGFVRRGDFVCVIEDDESRVYMRVNDDGSSQDPADYPECYFQFGRYSEPKETIEDALEDAIEDSTGNGE